MASEVRIGVRTDTGSSDRQITTLRGQLMALGQQAKSSILTGVGLGAGVAGFTLLGSAVESATRFVVGSIDAASDLNETVSKSAQIFGREAIPALDRWSDKASDSFGQSKRQALDAAATFAIFGKSAGKSGQDLVDFSTQLTELASDLASFHNASPEEAIIAIGAALRGESEPIRRFGVLLDDATLKARAMKLGIIETTTQALTPQQKVLAAQAEILAQTKDAQGDFARTQDGLANKTREVQAKMEDLSAQLGEKLLPVMVGLAEGVLIVVDAFEKLFGSIGRFIDYADPFISTNEEIVDKFNSTWGEIPGIAQMQMEATNEAVDHGVQQIVDTTITGTREAADSGAKEIGKLPEKSADELLDNQFHLRDAITELREFADRALAPWEEKARLRAFLASKALARGLESNNPLVRKKAEEMRDAAQAELDQLDGRTPGQKFVADFIAALEAGAATARAAMGRLVQTPAGSGFGATTFGVTSVGGGGMGAFGVSSFGGGGPGPITIALPATTIPYSPAQYRAAARDLVPELVRELRRQRLIP